MAPETSSPRHHVTLVCSDVAWGSTQGPSLQQRGLHKLLDLEAPISQAPRMRAEGSGSTAQPAVGVGRHLPDNPKTLWKKSSPVRTAHICGAPPGGRGAGRLPCIYDHNRHTPNERGEARRVSEAHRH